MSLPHAVITSLLEKSTSGYDLARRFDKSIGYFWHATHQQIYRELARLEEAGFVASEAEEGARGRKRNYKVLPAGKAELRRWMSQPSEHRNLRDEMMVRVRAAAIIGPQLVDRLSVANKKTLPAAEAYNSIFHLMVALLVVGLLANLLVRPVDPKHHAQPQT